MSLGNDRVRLVFPKMKVKFINKNKLDLAYNALKTNSRLSETYEKINEMDNYIMTKAKEYSKEWFKKNDLESVESNYIKQNKRNGSYDPMFRVKVVESKKGEILTEFFNTKKESIHIEDFDSLKGKTVDGIYEASELWFMDTDDGPKFGVIWNIVQMRIHDESTDLDGFAFIEE